MKAKREVLSPQRKSMVEAHDGSVSLMRGNLFWLPKIIRNDSVLLCACASGPQGMLTLRSKLSARMGSVSCAACWAKYVRQVSFRAW